MVEDFPSREKRKEGERERDENDEASRCVHMCAQGGRSEGHGYRQVSALPCRDNTDTMGDNIIHAGERTNVILGASLDNNR